MSEIGRRTGDTSLPYIFISYAHRNTRTVLPIIECLARRGARLWYDGGIELGKEWAADIERHIVECEVFMLFLSRDSANSLNCREEFALAREAGKSILVCYIEDLRPEELRHGLRLQIPSHQCIFLSRYSGAEELADELCGARIFLPCIGKPTTGEKSTKQKGTDSARKPAADISDAAASATPIATAPTASAAPIATAPKADAAATAPSAKPTPVKYSTGLKISEMGLLIGIGSCKDRDIVVPPNVHSIANGAFKHCGQLKSIVLPVGVTLIPDDAFNNCRNLRSVTLSAYTTHIGARAFYNCRRLEAVNFKGDARGGDVPRGFQYVMAKAFMHCVSYSPHWVGGERMIELGERAYYNCGIVQGGFFPCIKRIGRLALGKKLKTHANILYFTGTFQEWQQVKRNGKIMSCKVQYVKCNNGHDGFISEHSTDHIFE